MTGGQPEVKTFQTPRQNTQEMGMAQKLIFHPNFLMVMKIMMGNKSSFVLPIIIIITTTFHFVLFCCCRCRGLKPGFYFRAFQHIFFTCTRSFYFFFYHAATVTAFLLFIFSTLLNKL